MTLMTITEARRRLIEAYYDNSLVREDGGTYDGDPRNIPPEGRVHLDDLDGSVFLVLPENHPSGYAFADLGDAPDIANLMDA